MADMGSGGGFPGIPLAIATGRQTTLIESIGKKSRILESIVGELGLSGQVRVFSGRVEEMPKDDRGAFAVVTARALAKLGALMELATPLLRHGGRLICYKAHIDEEEAEKAKELQAALGMRLVGTREFVLSDDETFRSIVVFEKVSEPRIRLPRNVGMAQRKPL